MFSNAIAEKLCIVKNGNPNAVILLDSKPTRSAQMGALELQYHVKLITGATLPIVNKNTAKDKVVIKVGGENKGLAYETIKMQFSSNKI